MKSGNQRKVGTGKWGIVPNRFYIRGNCGYCVISRRDGTEWKAKFDAEDMPRVRSHEWRVLAGRANINYVCAQGNKYGVVLLHRFIMDTPADKECNILNGNNFDLRKQNLLNTTHSGIMKTTRRGHHPSPYPYVTWMKRNEHWRSLVVHNGRLKYVGAFDNVEDAYAAQQDYLRRHPRATIGAIKKAA